MEYYIALRMHKLPLCATVWIKIIMLSEGRNKRYCMTLWTFNDRLIYTNGCPKRGHSWKVGVKMVALQKWHYSMARSKWWSRGCVHSEKLIKLYTNARYLRYTSNYEVYQNNHNSKNPLPEDLYEFI